MTTGDAACDVTYMFAPVLVAELVKQTEEDEEVVAAASYLALAESVTKTVSTWVCCLALSLPLIIPSFLHQLIEGWILQMSRRAHSYPGKESHQSRYPLPLSVSSSPLHITAMDH